jgi:hypothetical protein
MTQLETFTTAGLEPRRKIEFWNDTACASFTPIVSDPVDLRNFNGRLTRTRFGDMRLGEVYSDAQTVRHLRAHVARTRTAMFFLQMQLEGGSINRQDGREANLGPGDFTLCDTTRPYEMQFENSNRMFVVGIPDTLLRRHLASPESVVAIPMSGSSGLSGLLSQFLRDFWTRCHDDFEPIVVPRVSRAILDLTAGAYTPLPQAQSDRSSLATSHRIRIVNYIEAHLGDDPALSASPFRGRIRDSRAIHPATSPRGVLTSAHDPGAAWPHGHRHRVRLRFQQSYAFRPRVPGPLRHDAA